MHSGHFWRRNDFSDPWLNEELALTEQMLPAPESAEIQASGIGSGARITMSSGRRLS